MYKYWHSNVLNVVVVASRLWGGGNGLPLILSPSFFWWGKWGSSTCPPFLFKTKTLLSRRALFYVKVKIIFEFFKEFPQRECAAKPPEASFFSSQRMVGKLYAWVSDFVNFFLEKEGGFKAHSLLLKAPTLLLNFLAGVNTPRAQKKSRKKD